MLFTACSVAPFRSSSMNWWRYATEKNWWAKIQNRYSLNSKSRYFRNSEINIHISSKHWLVNTIGALQTPKSHSQARKIWVWTNSECQLVDEKRTPEVEMRQREQHDIIWHNYVMICRSDSSIVWCEVCSSIPQPNVVIWRWHRTTEMSFEDDRSRLVACPRYCRACVWNLHSTETIPPVERYHIFVCWIFCSNRWMRLLQLTADACMINYTPDQMMSSVDFICVCGRYKWEHKEKGRVNFY
jgi:hypothetical protein